MDSHSDNIKDLHSQNQELKKKLIRIESEAKLERAQLLMQFDQLRFKIDDIEVKEKFLKNSQASLTELIMRMNPPRAPHEIGLSSEEIDRSCSAIIKPKTTEKIPTEIEIRGSFDREDSEASFHGKAETTSPLDNPTSSNFLSNSNIHSNYHHNITKEEVLKMTNCHKNSSRFTANPPSRIPLVKSQGTFKSPPTKKHVFSRPKMNSPVQVSPEFKQVDQIVANLDFTSTGDFQSTTNQQRNTPSIHTSDYYHNIDINNMSTSMMDNHVKIEYIPQSHSSQWRHQGSLKGGSETTERDLRAVGGQSKSWREGGSVNLSSIHEGGEKRKSGGKEAQRRAQIVLYNQYAMKSDQNQLRDGKRMGNEVKKSVERGGKRDNQDFINTCSLNIDNINIDFVRGKIGIKLQHSPNIKRILSNSRSCSKEKNGEKSKSRLSRNNNEGIKADEKSFIERVRSGEKQKRGAGSLVRMRPSEFKSETSEKRKVIEIKDCKDMQRAFGNRSDIEGAGLSQTRNEIKTTNSKLAILRKNEPPKSQSRLRELAKPMEPPRSRQSIYRPSLMNKIGIQPSLKSLLSQDIVRKDTRGTSQTRQNISYMMDRSIVGNTSKANITSFNNNSQCGSFINSTQRDSDKRRCNGVKYW